MNTSTQRPVRGIDHLVIAGSDLGQLAAFYRALGFTVGPKNHHPWGTDNHIIQFAGSFLELIGVGNPALIPPHQPGEFSFGAFVRDFIAGGDGLAMLVLASTNAVADAEAFRKAQIGASAPFHFERKGKAADGSDRIVSFTLAFAEMQASPRAGFFACQQHQPHNFWNAAAQQHANGASGIENVVLIAEDPADWHEFLGAFTGQREMRATSYGLELDLPRGSISVLSPIAFLHRFGVEPPPLSSSSLSFGAIEMRVSKLQAVKSQLDAAGIHWIERSPTCIIDAGQAHGIVIAFRE